MLYLLSKIQQSGQQLLEQEDIEVNAETIAVGSGEDQLLQLFGAGIAGAHVSIAGAAGNRASFECSAGQVVTCDGKEVSGGELDLGGTIELGSHLITLIEAPAGFDCCLQVYVDADAEESSRTRFRTSLEVTRNYNRPLAYVLSALVITAGLLLPLASFVGDGEDSFLRDHGLPSDSLWSSGPLIPAHRIPAIGENCNTCHVNAFEMVPDTQCLGCHEAITEHVVSEHSAFAEFAEIRCASCHKEHNEPATLVVREQELCVDCHGDLGQMRLAGTAAVTGGDRLATVRDVSGFNQDTHPEFRLGMLKFDGHGWSLERAANVDDELREHSNLKYPHDIHMDAAKVQSLQSGEGLECASCHLLDSAGEHFEPITMEAMCQDCHELTFDANYPERNLPHGQPALIKQTLDEFYIRSFVDPEAAGKGRTEQRRRPGQGGSGIARCADSPLQCGRDRAAEELDNQFSKTGCVTCHEVSRTESADWQVLPVRLNTDWYSKARFDHRSHLMLRKASEVEICLDCHEAASSKVSDDVLIPARDSCLECHDDDNRGQSVELDCVSCHNFHTREMDSMARSRLLPQSQESVQ